MPDTNSADKEMKPISDESDEPANEFVCEY